MNRTTTSRRVLLLCALTLGAATLSSCSSDAKSQVAGSSTKTVGASTAVTTRAATATTAATSRTTTADTTTADAPADTTPDDSTTVADATPPPASVPESPTTAAVDPDATTLPPGATPGLDDFDGDGQPDPTCGTQDFGGGLVLRIPCSIISANEAPEGTTLVADSLFRLPGESVAEFASLSGSLIDARDADGTKVRMVVFNTDGLFASGSAVINSFETMDATIQAINTDFPNGAIQVRGHTDGVGSVASNQALSDKRAETVRAYFSSHGILATSVTAVGLASTEPLVSETNADGTPNLEGRHFNRRVEIVIRLSS